MSNPPRIWLDYRPVRIGWVAEARDVAQLATAASWSICLWGGLFNPIIPIEDRDFSDKLIRAFGVDVLIPVAASNATTAFVDAYPHLNLRMWGGGVFKDRRSEFVDIRHAVRRVAGARAPLNLSAFVRPVWLPDDPMSAMLSALFGRYPSPEETTLNYVAGIRSSLAMPDRLIDQDAAIPAELSGAISPLDFTAFDLSLRREWHGWPDLGIVLGDATDFDDLLLFWNLRAAGATMSFFDRTRAARCKPFVDAFLASLREQVGDEHRRINFWGRGLAPPWNPESAGFDFSGLGPCICGGDHAALWNGMNIRPSRPQFSTRHHDVVASYTEGDTGETASFGFPDRPFDAEDPGALNQHFVDTVDANQYGSTSDDLTFETPYMPRLNEFYGRNFHFEPDTARSEPGSFGHGAVGFITTVGTQCLETRAFRVHDWLRSFFELVGIGIERSEPGLRSARLIRQFGGLRTSRVLKVRGARELIRKYGPDQNFTRSEAEKCIGNFDESTKRMRFSDFENLYIQPRSRGKLTPGEVLQYMTARGVFRVGLEFECPTCELRSWHHLDDVRTLSTCAYCGQQFDVTALERSGRALPSFGPLWSRR